MNTDRSDSASVTNIESAGLIVVTLLSPLWFFTIGGVNLNPADIIFLFVFASFTLRTGILPYTQSQKTGIAVMVFLTVVGLSVLWSSNKLGGMLSFAQYLLIFLGVVPIFSHALRDRSLRWRVFLALWAATTGLTFLGLHTYLTGDVGRYRHITLWYGNQNHFFWLVASSFIGSIALALEDSLPSSLRLASIALAAIEASLIVGGMTLSAILMVVGGVWLFTAFLAKRHSKRAMVGFLVATVVAGVAGLVFVVRNWEFIYIQGSLQTRISQYTTAVHLGIQHFPLGMGIDAYYPSVHNFFLNYFVEVGIVGASAFLALLIVWLREVLLRALRHPSRIDPFEFAFIVIFGTYILVMIFQPVPVHRFWWILFAASWAVAHDRLTT